MLALECFANSMSDLLLKCIYLWWYTCIKLYSKYYATYVVSGNFRIYLYASRDAPCIISFLAKDGAENNVLSGTK